MAFLPSFTATSGSTLRLATCRGCVTCWPLSWSSWMMVSGWLCPSLQCCSSGSAWGGSVGSHTQWGEPWGASKARPCRAPLVLCACSGEGCCVCVCVAGMVTLGADAAVPVQQSTTFCVPLAEALAFSCFTELMKRMNQNFPHGGAMDTHFANMRSLIQVGRQHRGSSLSGQ